MTKPVSEFYAPKPSLPVQQPVRLEYREPRINASVLVTWFALVVVGFAAGMILAAAWAGVL